MVFEHYICIAEVVFIKKLEMSKLVVKAVMVVIGMFFPIVCDAQSKPVCENPDTPVKLDFASFQKNIMLPEIKYPEDAYNAKAEGMVRIRCTVEPDGSVSEYKVLTPEIHKSLNDEGLRLTKLVGGFIPAKKDGKNVRAYYILPYRFKYKARK